MFVLACLLWTCAATALPLTHKDGLDHATSLSGHLWLLHDANGKNDIAAVAAPGRASEFRPLPGQLGEGFTSETIWLRFTLQAGDDTPRRWILEAFPPILDYLTLYAPDGRGGWVETRLGDRLPYAQRPIGHHNFAFPIDLAPGSSTYYLRVQSTSTLLLTLRLWQAPDFIVYTTGDYLSLGVALGALCVILLFNLALWLWLRDGIYLRYTIYLFGMGCLILFFEGYASQWLFPRSPQLADHGMGVALCLQFAAAVPFISAALRLRRLLPYVWRLFIAALVFFLCSLVVALAGYYPLIAPWVNRVALLMIMLAVGATVWLLARGHREIWLYAASFSVLYLSALGLLLRSLGVINSSESSLTLFHIGSVLHLLLLNFALIKRIKNAEERVRAREKQALSTALDAERALEHRVAERTAELWRANRTLAEQVEERTLLQRQLQSALLAERETLNLQRQFVSMVSHEFRTPLAVIDAAAQSMGLLHVSDDAAIDQRADKIRRAVARLTALVENCMSEDRLAMSSIALRLQEVDLRDILRDCASLLHDREAERLRLELPAAVTASCDADLVGIAIGNLIQNALKYSHASTPVTVCLTQDQGRARIDITDHGPGIPEAERERVFEKFYRSHAAARTPGAGLGLYLAREIALRHGGALRLAESGVAGSRFSLTLPAAPGAL